MKSFRIWSAVTVVLILGCLADASAQEGSRAPDTVDWWSLGGKDRSFTVANAGLLVPGEPCGLKILWRKPLGAGYSPVSVLGRRAVTMYSDEVSDYVVGLDAEDGSERWRYTIGPSFLGRYGAQSGPLSAPLVTERKVIALSPQGSLFALDATSGRRIWSVDLVKDHSGIVPFWGYTTSPLMHDDLLIVQTGGSEGRAISAFDPESGDHVWSACRDSVFYQSPSVFRLRGRDHLVFHGNRHLFGLVPETGEQLWTFEHGGQTNASSTSGHPVEVAEGRYFVKNRGNGGVLIHVSASDGAYAVEEIWRTRHIRGTYIYPVHHDGHIYGYNGRILTCINAATGERTWRSREPGDGLPIVVDGHLVIVTKDGKLAVAPASGKGYSEIARIKLFDDIVWAPASFGNGKLYARSMSEIACIEIVPEAEVADVAAPLAGVIPDSRFAAFVESVGQAADKASLVERYMSEQTTFPIIEGDSLVHLIYRGEADEVAMTGDLTGRHFDQPMNRVDGTDLFYYSTYIEPDARITYRYTVNLQKAMPDPLNPRGIRSRFYGRASWFGMPRWRAPDHLEERQDGVHGRIDTVRFVNDVGDINRVLEVYLPAGYDESSNERYPVVYVHDAKQARRLGQLDVSLDNLIGERVRPVIVVLLPSLVGGGYLQYVGPRRDEYIRLFVEEVVPFIDRTYPTIRDRDHRANFGRRFGGLKAFYATFTHPDLFGGLAIQTIYLDPMAGAESAHLFVPASSRPPLRIYMDWGKYDLRRPMEGYDYGKSIASFAALLESRGYTLVGGMVNDGGGWASWNNRTDRVFETLFPIVAD
ncbi:MAG: PQQ-binding-like beta-propeller repeat protein [Candidatus Latescibacteria bacterium]|nr:PQQ-binding-like beta-propeller repeat protein [Candidatus Latescibacterota bacterium]